MVVGGMIMFDGTRDPILNPLKIRRMINGKYITLDVIETSYEQDTHRVLLFDEDNYEFYDAKFIDQQFKEIKRLLPYD